MKRAYIVLGAESSCTRFITNLLIKAGCSGRTWNQNHEQEIDFKDPTDDLVVWRRTYPHKWDDVNNYPYVVNDTFGIPDTDGMYTRLVELGYQVKVVVTMRDFYTTSMSGVNVGFRPHTQTLEKAYHNTKEAYKFIFSFINKYNLDYVLINYESCVINGEKYFNEMLSLLGLNKLSDIGFRDENSKYYLDK
jgi:hypothetical protein|tara:strand:+ start:4407 stop:4979 length:573 start_codon:yes stop_codon:yes gene_type:complete